LYLRTTNKYYSLFNDHFNSTHHVSVAVLSPYKKLTHLINSPKNLLKLALLVAHFTE
jgi:hypothetical protein